eukprot:3444684-Rhodomonas_salina.1
MVVLQWDSVQGFVDVHQDRRGWCRLMIWQNNDPVALGLVSREEADAINHGHMFAGTELRKEVASSTEATLDWDMEGGIGMSGANAPDLEAEIAGCKGIIDESEVWKDVLGNQNIYSFTSFPSVVTWNHGMRKQDGVRVDGFKCSKSMFSRLPSVVTWTLHRGWKQGESDRVGGSNEEEGGMDVDEGGKLVEERRRGIQHWCAMAVDGLGEVVEDDRDGSAKKSAESEHQETGDLLYT